MSDQDSLNRIRQAQFTSEQIESLKHFAHNIYDAIYFDLYVADWSSGQLADDAADVGPTFEWHWLKRVSEPLLVGYAFAKPEANLDDLRSALRDIGYQFSQIMGGEERDDYDDVEKLCHDAFDQIFAQMEGESA